MQGVPIVKSTTIRNTSFSQAPRTPSSLIEALKTKHPARKPDLEAKSSNSITGTFRGLLRVLNGLRDSQVIMHR